MSWAAWILASAVFLAFYDLAKKASVRENAVLPVLLCSTVCGCAAYMIGLFAAGRGAAALAVDWRMLALAAAKSVIVASSWTFTFTALRTLPISIATPIRASAPALVFAVALVLYGERPTWIQGAGMLATFAGYFVFSWAGRHEGIDFLRNRAVWCAFAGMALSAVSSLWDKYVFQIAAAPVETVQLLFQVGLVVVYAALLVGERFVLRRRQAFEWRWTIPLVGAFLALADWLYFRGLALPGVPVSAGSLLRRVSVVVTFALGVVFFRERNVLRKALALAVVLLGAALICLGG